MKTIIIFFFCVAQLPTIIHGGAFGSKCFNNDEQSDPKEVETFPDSSETESSESESDGVDLINRVHPEVIQIKAKIDGIVRARGTIKNIFKPLKFLGIGCFSVTYRGELGQSKKIVAMKFSPTLQVVSSEMSEEELFDSRRGHIVNEYRMYSHLNAINNSMVEDYGIPAVYYYGKWDDCYLLAITLLDSKFKCNSDTNLRDIDILITLREYVRISKYLHSHGVCHFDSHLGNLMFRKNQGFLLDYNLAKKVNEAGKKKDWEIFLLNMCKLTGMDVNRYYTKRNLEKIERLESVILKNVLREFARNVFEARSPDYNGMHEFITKELKKCRVQEPALVSWLKNAQKNQAMAEWKNKPLPDITTIAEPSKITDFDYKEPNFEFFANFE